MVIDITIGRIATLINAGITIVQSTLALALAILLVYAMRNINPAISWSAITRRLHSSPWPTLLRTDSATSGSGAAVWSISILTITGAILVAAAGVITPLGLKDGPIVFSKYTLMDASYVKDSSPIGLATPSRNMHTYGRICGAFSLVPCPGNGDNANTSVIAPSTVKPFSSTSKGPFNMQFRRYQPSTAGHDYPMTEGDFGRHHSLILRNDIFAIEGLIVDLTDNPGVGLWNHTLPSLPNGGSWNEDVLWLEPVTSCVNMNITLEYNITIDPNITTQITSNDPVIIDTITLTDRGGIANLTKEYPGVYSRDGQQIDLYAHAYKGSVVSQFNLMKDLNVTRDQSYVGRSFMFNKTWDSPLKPGEVQFPLDFFNHLGESGTMREDRFNAGLLCQGYGGLDTANITNVGVSCFMILGPPVRTDNGDQRLADHNSSWMQTFHYCAGATRARIQTVTFSFNGTRELSDLRISRRNPSSDVLWAMEKTDMNIADIEPFWGHVADSYENDPSLWTLRSDAFYIPAGINDFTFGTTATTAGQPPSVLSTAWGNLRGSTSRKNPFSYGGRNDFAVLNTWESAMRDDAAIGASHISNLIWTDLVANNLMGNDTNTKLLAASKHTTVAYDYKYAIPAFLLLGLWVPAFLGAIFVLACGRVKLSHLRYLLNQTSVGRIVIGDSALTTISHTGEDATRGGDTRSAPAGYMHVAPTETTQEKASRLPTSIWAETVGQTLVGLAAAEDCRVVPDSNGDGTDSTHTGETGEGDPEKISGGNIRQRRLRKVLSELVSGDPEKDASAGGRQ